MRCAIREALRAACHLDAARLQFAIGDTGGGDAHLRESLALSRVPARAARVQLLQLARFRSGRTSERAGDSSGWRRRCVSRGRRGWCASRRDI